MPSPNIWLRRHAFFKNPHLQLRFSKLRSSRATGTRGSLPLDTFLDHHLFDVATQTTWMYNRRGKHWQEVFFYFYFWWNGFPLKPQRQIALKECAWQAPPIRVEFPSGIEMDDFQWGYMIQRMVNHQPKQLVKCPGATTSATSVSMAAEEVAKSAEALFPHRTQWGGVGPWEMKGWWFLSGGRLRCLKFLLYQNFSQICSGCEMH